MKSKSIGIIFLAGAALLASACHSIRRGEPIKGSPLALSAKAERGRLVFLRNCYPCHPNGEGGLGPSLNDKPAPRFLVKTQVRLGLGVMPSFPSNAISPAELDDLLDYVMALRHE